MEAFTTVLLDIVRWLIATLIMGLIILYSTIYSLQGVEYYLFFTAKLVTFAYLMAWGLALGAFLPVFTFLTAFAVYLVMLIVRQKRAFSNIFGGLYFLGILILLVSFWADWIQFGWEAQLHTHSTLNKWAFSFFCLGMLGIPKKISDNYVTYLQKHYYRILD